MAAAEKRKKTPPPVAPKKKRIKWNSDAVEEGKSSLTIILDWLTEPGNYQRYRGGDLSCGLLKNMLAGGIVGRLVDAGIKHRGVKDVTVKIAAIESSFKDAVSFLGVTGVGIENESNLCVAVLKHCPHYYELKDVMSERASVYLDVDNNSARLPGCRFSDRCPCTTSRFPFAPWLRRDGTCESGTASAPFPRPGALPPS